MNLIKKSVRADRTHASGPDALAWTGRTRADQTQQSGPDARERTGRFPTHVQGIELLIDG